MYILLYINCPSEKMFRTHLANFTEMLLCYKRKSINTVMENTHVHGAVTGQGVAMIKPAADTSFLHHLVVALPRA